MSDDPAIDDQTIDDQTIDDRAPEDPAAGDTATEDRAGAGAAPAAGARARRRSWPGALGRGAAVLVIAGVGYVLVVPTAPVQRSRLGLLVSRTSGVAGFGGPPVRAAEQPVLQSNLAALVDAARGHADEAGIWVSSWRGRGATGAAAVAFLAPTGAAAAKLRPELVSVAMGPASYQAEGLQREATWSVPGIPGSTGATYGPAKGAPPTAASVGEVIWASGRVVELDEVAITSGDPRPSTTTAGLHQAAHLAATEPGFTLAPTRYPPLASGLWAAGAALLAATAALGPVGLRRRRARRQREREELAARTIRVGSQVIVRNRRGA